MSDSKSLGATVMESVVKPVKDEVGKMVEAGVQSITGSNSAPVDPKEEAKKREEEEKKKKNIMQFLNQYTADQNRYQEQVNAERQKKMEATQQVAQTKQVEEMKEDKKKQDLAVAQAQTRTEAKQGVGG